MSIMKNKDLESYIANIEDQTNADADGKVSLFKSICLAIKDFIKAYSSVGAQDSVHLQHFVTLMTSGVGHILSYAKYWEKNLGAYDELKNSDPASPSKINIFGRETISVVILAKNEEAKIRTCLESIKWVDEIVLLDGYSDDQTVPICEEYNVKIVRHKFSGDFGHERNVGNDNCTGDWILQLDADEVVTEGFKEKVKDILVDGTEYSAFKFLRKNFFMGHFMKYGGWYHYSHHFFKRGKAHYDGRVHHQLVVDGEIGQLKADVEHYPFQSFSQIVVRQNRYTTIEAKELLQLFGKMDDKEIIYNIKVKPLKLFWKFYMKKFGFRLGIRGLIFSMIFAWVHFLKWAKYWEIINKP
jgi:glycosyltransferase involved in cell wall biosynthesis